VASNLCDSGSGQPLRIVPPPEPDPPPVDPDPPVLGADEEAGGEVVVAAGAGVVALCVGVDDGGAATCRGLGRGRSAGSDDAADGCVMAGPDATGIFREVGIGDPDEELEPVALPIRRATTNRTTTTAASRIRRAGDRGA
jgi:hypothetical protein